MKPFNLDSARRGDPVCTADGREVRLYAFDAPTSHRGMPQPVLGACNDGDDWVPMSWSVDGLYIQDPGAEDLRMAPRKETRWVVTWVYNERVYGDAYRTESEAKARLCEIEGEPYRHSFSINPIEVTL